MALKAIQKNWKRLLEEEPTPLVYAAPLSADMFQWRGIIIGPSGTPYAGGLFYISIEFPSDYPFKAPKFLFETRIYHPNVNAQGEICLDILEDMWSPVYYTDICKVLLSICSLLDDPGLEKPLVIPIAHEFKNNRVKFDATAREWTRLYATRSADMQLWRRALSGSDMLDLSNHLHGFSDYPTASGGFADIYAATLEYEQKPTLVAVKVLRVHLEEAGTDAAVKERLSRELKVWHRLEHPHVLPLLGVAHTFGDIPAMVSPWMKNGSLTAHLSRGALQITPKDRMNLLSQIACGLHYLHSLEQPIVHGDLKAANILINDAGQAFISDFGLSRLLGELGDTLSVTSTFRGSLRWTAPELMLPDQDNHVPRPTTRSDIYSFGGIMQEVIAGSVPYYNIRNEAQVIIQISRGVQPLRPEHPLLQDRHWKFMLALWSKDPAARPTAEEARARVDFFRWTLCFDAASVPAP